AARRLPRARTRAAPRARGDRPPRPARGAAPGRARGVRRRGVARRAPRGRRPRGVDRALPPARRGGRGVLLPLRLPPRPAVGAYAEAAPRGRHARPPGARSGPAPGRRHGRGRARAARDRGARAARRPRPAGARLRQRAHLGGRGAARLDLVARAGAAGAALIRSRPMDFGIALAPGVDAWKVVERAERLGFTHAWFYDTQMLCADVFVAMALAAAPSAK